MNWFSGFEWDWWVALGLLAQVVFSGRFIVQWIYSERKKESVIPVAFWYMSLLGGVMLLIYAIHKQDPVFILGQSTGVIVYIRNLHLISKNKKNT